MSANASESSPPIPADAWEKIEAQPEFRQLLSDKARFIIPATLFFCVYYFALPVLVGYFPDLMKKKAFGSMNWAYAFALSQFFMAWSLAFVYMRVAARWDKEAAAVIDKQA